MTPLSIGMYVLLALGIATGIVALVIFVQDKTGIKRPIAAAMFAVLLLGLGTFGLAFMDPYTRLLGTLAGTTGEESDSPKYAAFFDKVANGKVDDKHAGVGIAHALNSPVPDMDKLIERSIRTGKSEAGKQRLKSVLAALRVKSVEADAAIDKANPASGPPGGPETISTADLDPGVRKIVEQRLIVMPKDEFAKLALDPAFRRTIEAKRTR